MTTSHTRVGRSSDGASGSDPETYELTLFVSGPSDVSEHAIVTARELCDVHLAGRARLTVVDVHADGGADLGAWMLATPTLARTLPLPVRKVVGSFSDTARVLEALGLSLAAEPVTAKD